MSATSHIPSLSARLSALRKHFTDVVLPLWREAGFNAALALPYESLDAQNGRAWPVQRYRAMACARQLYVYSCAEDQASARHAERLFDALHRVFQDAARQGWRYSVDAQGQALDERQDLYTHAFIVYACAAYFRRSRSSQARRSMLQTAEAIEARFKRPDGLYNAVLSPDWRQCVTGPIQNPMMHLTEAYLAAAQVAEPAWFGERLRQLAQAMAQTFVHQRTHTIAEAPLGSQETTMEPGHQFEWFALLSSAPEVFEGLGLSHAVPRALQWACKHGVDPATQGVHATLDEHGSVRDATQRIWAQAEYARALALSGDFAALETQLAFFQARFLHAGGWYECLDSEGRVVRQDMPSTTPYHLASCYAALPAA